MKVHPNIVKARGYLSYEKHYFGTSLWAMQFIEKKGMQDEFGSPSGADRYWRVYYDPDIIAKLTLHQTAFIILHELYHLIRGHAERAEARGIGPLNYMAWSLACDCEINDDLLNDPSIDCEGAEKALGAQFAFPGRLEPPQENGKTAEIYYDTLPKQKIQVQISNCGSATSGVPQPWEDQRPPSKGGQDGKESVPGIGRAEAAIIRKYTAEKIKEYIKAQGTVPAGLERWANEYGKSPINWHKQLAQLIRNNLATAYGQQDYTYMRYNRRQPFLNRISGGIIMPTMVKPTPRFAVIADASASMGDDGLAIAARETEAILHSFGVDAPFYSCDAAATSKKNIHSAKQINFEGGGGTDMRVGIAKAEEENDRLDCIIVITDGLTPWPDKPPRYKVVAVLTEESAANDVPSFIKVVQVPQK